MRPSTAWYWDKYDANQSCYANAEAAAKLIHEKEVRTHQASGSQKILLAAPNRAPRLDECKSFIASSFKPTKVTGKPLGDVTVLKRCFRDYITGENVEPMHFVSVTYLQPVEKQIPVSMHYYDSAGGLSKKNVYLAQDPFGEIHCTEAKSPR